MGKIWPQKVHPGRAVVTVHRRSALSGNPAFKVVIYAEGKRRFDSFSAGSVAPLTVAPAPGQRLRAA